MIDWCAFSWEAAVGLLAVAGATIVGWRQVGISTQANRVAVFQLRFSVFESTQRFVVSAWNLSGAVPLALMQEFDAAREKAKFLFDENVQAKLKDIWDNASKLKCVCEEIEGDRANGMPFDRAKGSEKKSLRDWLGAQLGSLPQLFADVKVDAKL